MSGVAPRAPSVIGAGQRQMLAVTGQLIAAIAVGVATAVGAYAVHPLLVPAAMLAAALVSCTLSRPEVGIAAWFALVPLGAIGALGQPPWLVSSLWALFLFIVAVGPGANLGSVARLPPLSLPILLLLVVTLIQSALTDTLSAAFPVVRVLVVGALMFFAIALLVRERRHFVWVLSGMAAGAGLVGAVALREWTVGGSTVGFITQSGELVGRVSGGFGQPNALAGFLVVLVPFCAAGAILARRGRVLLWAAAVLAVTGIYLSLSRGALLGLAVVPLAFLGLRRSLLVAPLLIVLAVAVTPNILRERFATASLQGSEAATRIDIWSTAVSIWEANPILGVGPGGFPAAYATVRVPGKQFLPSTQFEPPPHAHNIVLQFLSEQGLLGLTAFGLIMGLALHALTRVRRTADPWMKLSAAALLAALAAFTVHNMLDVTLLEGTGQEFWAILGLVSALAALTPRIGAQEGVRS